jgi:O-antigen/teichoic acid export membrane protein
MFGFISIGTTYIFGTLLTANGSLKALNLMAFAGMVLNISLNLVLIPRFQALGSAVASLITQSITAFIQVIIAIKIFKFQINYKLLILLLIFASGVLLIGIISTDLPYNWLIQAGIMVILSVTLAFGIGIVRIKDMYQIIKSEK